jgi:hypothetical protein
VRSKGSATCADMVIDALIVETVLTVLGGE